MAALAALLLLAAAAQGPSPAADERRVAQEVLEQLLAEDDSIYHLRDSLGSDHLEIHGRALASSQGGICRSDRLSLERDPAAGHGPGGRPSIREMKVTHYFLILTGPGDGPQWDVSGEALERSCASPDLSGFWFVAEEDWQVKEAVLALLALQEELLKPDPRPGVWSCPKRLRCPDRRALAEHLRPLSPNTVFGGEAAHIPCPEDKYCLSASIDDPVCGGWVVQLRMDPDGEHRFHSARVGWALGGLHCGEIDMAPEAGG